MNIAPIPKLTFTPKNPPSTKAVIIGIKVLESAYTTTSTI